MGLNQPPEFLWLLGEEWREDLNFLVYPEAHSNANELLIDPHEDGIGNVQVVNFVDPQIPDVELWRLFDHISRRLLFQVLEQNGVNPLIL